MTAIKHTLQRDVFLPSDERLVGLVHVTKAGKKKKTSFLCAAVTTERPVSARVYQVKKSDKGEIYKKKVSWLLRELKVVDGKDCHKETAEFDLQFEKAYRWLASSVADKEAFILCLWKLSQRYLLQKVKPEFVNVPPYLLEEVSLLHDQSQSLQHGDDIVLPDDEDYQALTSKEEADLELLMSECHIAIKNAEVFTEQLSKQLSMLDGANIHSIMGSEDQVFNLMRLLDEGIDEATKVEQKLNAYDVALGTVRDQMEMMKEKDDMMQKLNTNHQKLLEELDNIVNCLNLDTKYVKSLFDGDLTSPGGIYDCTLAADALQKCVHADIHPALCKMSAVEEQQKRFGKLQANFAKRLAHHLNNFFIHQGNEMGETLIKFAGELQLPQHHSSHRDLTPYTELMLWLKNSEFNIFKELKKVYTDNLKRLYDREIGEFLESARQRLIGRTEKGKLGSANTRLMESSTSLTKPDRTRSGSIQSIDSASHSYHGSDTDLAQRQIFDQVFEKVLSELEPVCLAEQDFCVRFFGLIDLQVLEKVREEPVDALSDEVWMPRKATSATENFFVENLGEGLTKIRSSTMVRQMNEEVRKMMLELFPNLEKEVENFIVFADGLNGFNSMYMLVRMGQHVINTQDTGSFLSMTFASSLVKIKRNFDKFIQIQIRAIEESRISKKSRCGIISFVHNFEEFANHAESIFRGWDRRADLDKAYVRLVKVVFDQIIRVANEHPKTPKEVILMENFHHMNAVLYQLKIICLDSERKDAKQRYLDNLYAYTVAYLGRPMEKLHVFFDGVQSCVAAGVKEEEVGYQLAYSKQELRKVIKEYPGKEVKKGLDHLYKRVEKQLCDEENLLQVVWVNMQDEFIKQYKYFDQLINKCYPDSKITLDITMDNVLQYFSDIARSH